MTGTGRLRFGVKHPWRHPIRATRILYRRCLRKHQPAKFAAWAHARVARDIDRREAELRAAKLQRQIAS